MIIEQLKHSELFTKAENEVVEFILENPRRVTEMTIDELAGQTFSSNSSIVRICKKVGMKGFSEFKIKIASELNTFILTQSRLDPDIPISPGSTREEIAREILNLQYQALTDIYNTLDFDQVWKAAQLIDQSDLVLMYGRGESLLPLRCLQADLVRIGKRSSCESIIGFDAVFPCDDQIKKCAVILTQYGDSKQIGEAFNELHRENIPIIMIHGNQKNMLSKRAAVSISFDNMETHSKFAACASRVTKYYILDLIYSFLFSMHYNKNIKSVMEHSELVFERRKRMNNLQEEEIIHKVK
ncbi:MurR/RpiR family transcriptional regulator [Holdemania massiliensis]|uniref:MurR/RpiR family transcriptional regulator n=1 Tax=Holdemania massiliensis TaxID=1468449 RepID=UPI001F06B399|nr:MurR/RpiR family transcriptional regulator [Holdemania massiliensis]MCH1942466.1 MurR/RpiR family transcriptional regulator [Holdemania massiliensis]